MTMSVSRTASAAEAAARTPMASPAALRPEAIAWPASPKPIKEIRGVLRRFMMQTHSGVRKAGNGGRALGVERFDRLQAPGLTLLSLRFGPGDRLPVGGKHEPRACA